MTPQESAEKAEKAYQSLEYPDKPDKPIKVNSETNADFGKRLDAYNYEMAEFRERLKLYRESVHKVELRFRADLLEALGIQNHPKANKLYDMAWEEGHSEGYRCVADVAEELAELIKE